MCLFVSGVKCTLTCHDLLNILNNKYKEGEGEGVHNYVPSLTFNYDCFEF